MGKSKPPVAPDAAQKSTGKAVGRPIKPGQVLNPGGRPKLPEEFKRRAPEALMALLKMAVGEIKVPPAVRMRAAEVCVERYYHKIPIVDEPWWEAEHGRGEGDKPVSLREVHIKIVGGSVMKIDTPAE